MVRCSEPHLLKVLPFVTEDSFLEAMEEEN